MSIYKIILRNYQNNKNELVFENFKDENDISKFKRENKIAYDDIVFKKADSLIESLSLLAYNDWDYNLNGDYCDSCKHPVLYLATFIDKFGIELLKNQFAYEMQNLDLLIQSVQELAEEMIQKTKDQCFEFLEEEQNTIDHENCDNEGEKYNDLLDDMAEGEMRQWDEEDPTWRIANDLD